MNLESAARAYDAAAIAEHGPDAVVNFPLDCNLSPAFTSRHKQSHGVEVGGGSGQGQAVQSGLMPAGNAGSKPAPVCTPIRSNRHGPRVSLTSSGYYLPGLVRVSIVEYSFKTSKYSSLGFAWV